MSRCRQVFCFLHNIVGYTLDELYFAGAGPCLEHSVDGDNNISTSQLMFDLLPTSQNPAGSSESLRVLCSKLIHYLG